MLPIAIQPASFTNIYMIENLACTREYKKKIDQTFHVLVPALHYSVWEVCLSVKLYYKGLLLFQDYFKNCSLFKIVDWERWFICLYGHCVMVF